MLSREASLKEDSGTGPEFVCVETLPQKTSPCLQRLESLPMQNNLTRLMHILVDDPQTHSTKMWPNWWINYSKCFQSYYSYFQNMFQIQKLHVEHYPTLWFLQFDSCMFHGHDVRPRNPWNTKMYLARGMNKRLCMLFFLYFVASTWNFAFWKNLFLSNFLNLHLILLSWCEKGSVFVFILL